MLIVSVVGARPNFMKLAPIERELARRPDVEHVVVHTGQHYDTEMSDAFFQELWIPRPSTTSASAPARTRSRRRRDAANRADFSARPP